MGNGQLTMFGNPLGWKISIVILALNTGAMFWLRGEMQVTGPTGLSMDPKHLEALVLPAPAEEIVKHDGVGDAGTKYAGEKYLAAAGAMGDEEDACDEYAQKLEGDVPGPMQELIDATRLPIGGVFGGNPSVIVNYDADHAPLDALTKLGEDMESAALRLGKAGKTDDAKKFLLAVYALGENLANERLTYEEFSHGMGLMDGAATALADLEPAGSQRAAALTNQNDAMVSFDEQQVRPVYEVLASADPTRVAANAGDVIRFARLAKERMFRVEAILKLGRYRFDAARGADQLAAPRILKKLQGEPDPVIQTAAGAGLGLTIKQYRMIH